MFFRRTNHEHALLAVFWVHHGLTLCTDSQCPPLFKARQHIFFSRSLFAEPRSICMSSLDFEAGLASSRSSHVTILNSLTKVIAGSRFFFLCTYTPDVNAPVFSWCLSPQLLVSLLFSEFDQSRNQQRGSFIQHEAKNSVSFVFQACPPHTATLDRRKGLPSQLFQVTALFMR